MTLRDFRRFINSFRDPYDAKVKQWQTRSPIVKFVSWPFYMPHTYLPQFVRWLFRQPNDRSD